ncbi:hypothetical protein HII31_13038 [Pseudocercospora fuligena]|uniref:Uncharacterized protein n=1 Tax=Pseudocercospora fuligena TaxID=685502 RepID=A0A8H6R6W1_9PEZI|nr:hypothetical protein HII31_13038 [Pseudocercospora fuligena]
MGTSTRDNAPARAVDNSWKTDIGAGGDASGWQADGDTGGDNMNGGFSLHPSRWASVATVVTRCFNCREVDRNKVIALIYASSANQGLPRRGPHCQRVQC